MFLYENNGEFVDVYKLEPKIEEIKKYRKKEMGRIRKKDRFYYAETNDIELKKLESASDVIQYDKLNVRGTKFGNHYFHDFYPYYSPEYSGKFLKAYLEDEEFIYNLYRVSMDKDDMFILCLNKTYDYCRHTRVPYVMDGIIRITESLYLLELLLRGRTNLIGNSDISEQLNLFDISYVDSIQISILKNICEYQVVMEPYESIMARTEKNKDVMGKVKVRVKK